MLVDGRPSLASELKRASKELRQFVAEEIATLLSSRGFLDCLPGHLPPDEASQQRLQLVMSRLRSIAALAEPETRRTAGAPRAMAPQVRPTRTTPMARSAMGPNTWRPRRPGNIAGFAYDAASRILTVHFSSGRVYEYDGVPAQVVEGWKAAASAGRYHHQWIRDRYHYRRVV